MNIERTPINGLNWFKSTYSAGDGGECIEVAAADQAVLVRDSKDTSLPHLTLTHAGWTHFVRYAAGA
ncbi:MULTISPECIES: DUF397 domain-containing protein [unclassified Streptomyces]|uniref:DUF397 domain-containing protein n=1 Tax=unclassified Streptomyces TaxID=2593676 RepID=UPI0022524F49|nr:MULTISPECIES: DUF397 domain-containing protein [unclassified Streptomyces]WSP54401.1 DUF397 domain-containing protein [Streptomyces sp. NBC_01241]WSU24924.1 DUF397 domain-containing protein [Streptomyces sp. NBC_01108]MCX4785929.1 DUF397 domain-containing protein [Streptomyces sp. NBC_01221]MCX4798214.1 DUF397 domain-containing protein [Streptomyces sp. NBC_01242]WSJ39459.1 DUF397 domain-containing protein [Streptomyces sp. NBC_01321]